jgi:hypothetical protein
MKRWLRAACVLMLAAMLLAGYQAYPRIASVEPDTGKTGDMASAKGENLAKKVVGELFFTDGKTDVKVEVTEQNDTEIKFKVPKIGAGRYRLMVVTANKSSAIEQPVIFTVE